VLDGGHMVFLLYEKLVGRPVPELIRTSATFANASKRAWAGTYPKAHA